MVSTALPPIPTHSTRQLLRADLSKAGLHAPLTPGPLQANRVATRSDGTFVFATGTTVYSLSISAPRKRPRASATTTTTTTTTTTNPDQHGHVRPGDDADDGGGVAADDHGNQVIDAIADDYLVPRALPPPTPERMPLHCAHRTEIQSVVADGARVASADALGRVVVTFDSTGRGNNNNNNNNNNKNSTVTPSFALQPPSLTAGEPGWAGVALRRHDDACVAVARQFFRDVTVFDRDVAVRELHCLSAPGAVAFAGVGSDDGGRGCGSVFGGVGEVLTVTEGADVAMYDVRAAERGGCVLRKAVASGALLALDVGVDGAATAVAGMDRVVHLFDVRMGGVRERWASCLKYECAGVLLSRETEGLAYVCSVDNEVACGAWSSLLAESVKRAGGGQSLMISGANTKSARRAFGFRADVRIVGMARRDAGGGEQVGVLSESGAFYLVRAREDAVLDP